MLSVHTHPGGLGRGRAQRGPALRGSPLTLLLILSCWRWVGGRGNPSLTLPWVHFLCYFPCVGRDEVAQDLEEIWVSDPAPHPQLLVMGGRKEWRGNPSLTLPLGALLVPLFLCVKG